MFISCLECLFRKLSTDDTPPPPPPDPKPPSSRKKTVDKGSRKKSKKSEDKGKGKPHGKLPPPPGKGKPLPASGKKLPATKKKGHAIYSELQLQMNSSEEDDASKLRDKDFALAADLGWDPTAYYPDPPEATDETKLSKLIDLRGELSSPLMMHNCKFLRLHMPVCE